MKRVTRLTVLAVFALVFACMVSQVHASGGKVNINSANKEELMTLKYVGETIADRIIEYRKGHPFKEPSDIMKVKGIGQKVFDVNKDMIIVQDE